MYIKEKIFEVIHCLGSDDKIYLQDFYFYISMYHIHYHYGEKIQIPEFKKICYKFENSHIKRILRLIKAEKDYILDFVISYSNCINSKSKLSIN